MGGGERERWEREGWVEERESDGWRRERGMGGEREGWVELESMGFHASTSGNEATSKLNRSLVHSEITVVISHYITFGEIHWLQRGV